ncbi:hypothetical protein BJX99DRAFT_228717 [Aspergillus californicus]
MLLFMAAMTPFPGSSIATSGKRNIMTRCACWPYHDRQSRSFELLVSPPQNMEIYAR